MPRQRYYMPDAKKDIHTETWVAEAAAAAEMKIEMMRRIYRDVLLPQQSIAWLAKGGQGVYIFQPCHVPGMVPASFVAFFLPFINIITCHVDATALLLSCHTCHCSSHAMFYPPPMTLPATLWCLSWATATPLHWCHDTIITQVFDTLYYDDIYYIIWDIYAMRWWHDAEYISCCRHDKKRLSEMSYHEMTYIVTWSHWYNSCRCQAWQVMRG